MRTELRLYVRSFLFTLMLLCSFSVLAQTFRGGITGTVTDESGAAIPSVPVTATNVDTGAVHQTVSSSAGAYTFQDIPLGTYSVAVAAPGFESVRIDKITVTAGQIVDLPIKVGIAHQTETVVVNAEALNLDTASTANTATLSTQTVQDLPLNGRDYTQMIALTPGYSGYAGNQGFSGSLNGARPQPNQLAD